MCYLNKVKTQSPYSEFPGKLSTFGITQSSALLALLWPPNWALQEGWSLRIRQKHDAWVTPVKLSPEVSSPPTPWPTQILTHLFKSIIQRHLDQQSQHRLIKYVKILFKSQGYESGSLKITIPDYCIMEKIYEWKHQYDSKNIPGKLDMV